MTDSAKQKATTKPAEDSAPAAPTKAAEVADVTEADAGADTGSDTGSDATGPDAEAKPELDDVKARFREALDRKRQVHAEGQGKGGHEAGKVNGAHGPAASRRSFRRKSG